VHPDQQRGHLRAERREPRQLDLDDVTRREPIHPEVRNELERRQAINELVRPALRLADGGPDRVRVAEGDIAHGADPLPSSPPAAYGSREYASTSRSSNRSRSIAMPTCALTRRPLRSTRRSRPSHTVLPRPGPDPVSIWTS